MGVAEDQNSLLEALITALHYGFPAASFLYLTLSLVITVCTLQSQSLRVRDQKVRRDLILGLILAVSAAYVIEACVLALECASFSRNISGKGAPPDASQDHVVYLLASAITFAIEAIALSDAKFPVWYPYYGTWFLGVVAEITLAIVSKVVRGPPTTSYQIVAVVIQVIRICLFLTLPTLYFGLRNDREKYVDGDAERQSLLSKKLAAKASSTEESMAAAKGYGTTSDSGSESVSDTESEDSWVAQQRATQDKIAQRLKQEGNWFTYAKGFLIFFPYVWPIHSKSLQFRAVLVACCLLASNALNVLVPRQLGIMIDTLSEYLKDDSGGSTPNIWLPVFLYALLLFISGGACIGWLRTWLWMPVEQYSYDALSTASHAHIMNLSSDFHDNKSSADLSQAISGGRSVSNLLETVCFSVIPMFIDLIVAFGYLSSLFGPYMGLVLAVEAIVYLYTTTKLVAMRAEKRREYIAIYRKEWSVGQQSLDGWNTASLFNQIPYEQSRYSGAVKDHMKSKRKYELSSQSISAAQGGVTAIGLLGALFLGVYQVKDGTKSVGNLTQLLVYWAQLQAPLSFFSNMYRNISYSLMDAERLLELFQTKPTITDSPNSKPLKLAEGQVEFNNVSFAYDERKPTLKKVSFVVPSGKTVALVGETGGGKTTILKLIDRFYDCTNGSISIDGQDIRDVTLNSLRASIGVVPQDPLMFHDTIMNNIRYARLSATDEEVYDACRAAALHDKIMGFPDGYKSKVGDRGVKLSGGEKQRVAIARAMLKQPEIILLDEATSAVDTETEAHIQKGFRTLCEGRTTFIVAHRLSTVMRADHILVVMNGEIVEQGSHLGLISKKGKYHDLWSKQIFILPEDKRARSKSPKKRDGQLVNDLSPGRGEVELAKATKAATENDGATDQHEMSGTITPISGITEFSDGENCHREGAPVTQQASTPKGNGGELNSVHSCEGSTLKPDAPEFVPFHVKFQSPGPVRKASVKWAAKIAKEERKMAAGLEKKVARRSSKTSDCSEGETIASASEVPPTSESLTEVGAEGDISGSHKPKLRRTRASRRLNAKSEPAPRVQDTMDGALDSGKNTTGSGESQSSIQPTANQRRGSAPSDPPAGRGRRGRPSWKFKNRVGSALSQTTSSEGRSTEDASASAVHNNTPVDRLPPAPAQRMGTTTTISFAPAA